MNRIEEIKAHKLDRYKYYDAISGQEYEDDVQYLISKLEQAERTFSKIEELSSDLQDVLDGVQRIKVDRIKQVAKVARDHINES